MVCLGVLTIDNQSLKLVAYHLVHTDKPYINLHLLHLSSVQHQIPRDAQGAARTSNLRITRTELRTTYAELRKCMWNFCGIHAEFRNALRNSAKVSQHAEFVPHPTSEYFPHLYGKFAENSDLVFLHSGTMRKIST